MPHVGLVDTSLVGPLYDDFLDSVQVVLLSYSLWRYLRWGLAIFTDHDRGILKLPFHFAVRYIQHMLRAVW